MMELLQLELRSSNYDPDSQERASLYKTCTKKHLYSKYVQYSHHENGGKKKKNPKPGQLCLVTRIKEDAGEMSD